MNTKWLNIIKHPSCMLIIGARGAGKSGLGYYLLELFYRERCLHPFTVGLPFDKQYLVPKYIHCIEDVDDLPESCIAFIDESALKYHAYKWRSKETACMDRMVSASRQKDQTLIFATHTMRKFAMPLLLDIDAILFKKPSFIHTRFERVEMRDLIKEAMNSFVGLMEKGHEDIGKYTYAYTENHVGLIENPLPSFWTEELSNVWKGIPLISQDEQEKEPREPKITQQQIVRAVAELIGPKRKK